VFHCWPGGILYRQGPAGKIDYATAQGKMALIEWRLLHNFPFLLPRYISCASILLPVQVGKCVKKRDEKA
jgi:hypothetical protein